MNYLERFKNENQQVVNEHKYHTVFEHGCPMLVTTITISHYIHDTILQCLQKCLQMLTKMLIITHCMLP